MSRDTARVSVNYKLSHLVPKGQQAKTGITIFSEVIDPSQQEIRLLLNNGNWEEYLCNPGDPLGYLLILFCPIVIVNKHVKQPQSEKGMTIKCSVWEGLGHMPPRSELAAESSRN